MHGVEDVDQAYTLVDVAAGSEPAFEHFEGDCVDVEEDLEGGGFVVVTALLHYTLRSAATQLVVGIYFNREF